MTTVEFYLNDIWAKTLDKVTKSGQIPESVLPYFESKLTALNDEEASVAAPTFINYSIMNQNSPVIANCLEEVIGKKLHINVFQVDTEANKKQEQIIVKSEFISREIDPNQNFSNFVVGRSNSQAHVASLTCATNLGIVYNPLLIYGNSGLGKTHLLNAIGNQIKSLYPDKRIGFISGLEFVEAVHKADRSNKYDEFKKNFHDLDVLLVDDIQFIAGKPKTHELFFSIFNDLVNNKKQICITSDRTPNEIKGLEDRIISRLYQGLNVNIEAPEYETSINILKMKIQNNSNLNFLSVDDDVLNYLATNFSQDVRSLEGAVNRLLFYSINFPLEENSNRITLKLAFEAFKDQVKENKNELSITNIRKAVCNYYNLSKQQIVSANRTKNVSNARQIAMYLCRKHLDATYDDIGKEFGGRDHSTVMSSCENVEKKIKTDPLYLKAINEIETQFK